MWFFFSGYAKIIVSIRMYLVQEMMPIA